MLEGLEGTLCHANDILVFGATHKENDARLLKVLNRLERTGLTLNEKCEFAMPQGSWDISLTQRAYEQTLTK